MNLTLLPFGLGFGAGDAGFLRDLLADRTFRTVRFRRRRNGELQRALRRIRLTDGVRRC